MPTGSRELGRTPRSGASCAQHAQGRARRGEGEPRIVGAMELERIPARETERIAGALERDGAVIVEDLLGPDLLARFNAEIDPIIETAPRAKDRKFINDAIQWFFGAQTRDVAGVAGRSRVFATEILTHPVYRA